MTKFKKTLLGVAAAMVLAAPMANAGLVNVGGVVWDPDWTDGGSPAIEQDFVAEFKFTQWFTKTVGTVGSINDWANAVGIGEVVNDLDGSAAPTDYYLKGVGEFDRINDPAMSVTIANTSGGSATSFCPGCELTFAFGGIGLNKNSTFDLTNAWARVYVDRTGDPSLNYVPPANSQDRVNDALNGDVWLDMKFSSLAITTGTVNNGQVSATFNIIGGLAANNFDPKRIEYSASTFFSSAPPSSPNFNTNAKYSNAGNGQALGNTIPEPASLALLGLGLLGMGGVSASRKRAKA